MSNRFDQQVPRTDWQPVPPIDPEITRRYRRIAGFDVETLNRKSGQEHQNRGAAA
jgi:hypothetical protein